MPFVIKYSYGTPSPLPLIPFYPITLLCSIHLRKQGYGGASRKQSGPKKFIDDKKMQSDLIGSYRKLNPIYCFYLENYWKSLAHV